jgi:proteasome assembly chaperone 2
LLISYRFVILKGRLSVSRTPVYYYRPRQSPSSPGTLAALGDLPVPEYTPTSTPAQPSGTASEDPFIPGGGLTRRILTSLGAEWQIPTVALLQFVLEGDNRPDARIMATVVARVLAVVDRLPLDGWKEPLSWRQGLFGGSHDSTLYG